MNARELLTWDMYFSGVTAMRFHPKNVEHLVTLDPEFLQRIVTKCAQVADIMILEHQRRDSQAYRTRADGD